MEMKGYQRGIFRTAPRLSLPFIVINRLRTALPNVSRSTNCSQSFSQVPYKGSNVKGLRVVSVDLAHDTWFHHFRPVSPFVIAAAHAVGIDPLLLILCFPAPFIAPLLLLTIDLQYCLLISSAAYEDPCSLPVRLWIQAANDFRENHYLCHLVLDLSSRNSLVEVLTVVSSTRFIPLASPRVFFLIRVGLHPGQLTTLLYEQFPVSL